MKNPAENVHLTRKSLPKVVFVIALALFAALGFLADRNMTAVKQAIYWTNHTYAVILKLDYLLQCITDAETGQRGFIITGNDDYLTPYSKALQNISQLQSSLRELTADNPAQQQRLQRLDSLVEKKLAEMKATLECRRSQGLEATSRLVMNHLGNNLMVEIRRTADEAEQTENQLLLQRQRTRDAELARSRRAIVGGGIIGFSMLLLVFYLLSKEIAQRSAAEAAVVARNEELERARHLERANGWIKTGINELNSRIRGDHPLHAVANQALSFLSGYLKAGTGLLYLFEEKSETLRVAANYAFTGDRAVNGTIRLGEGVTGEAAREKRSIILKEVPAGYLAIGSALGEAPPASVLAVPLVHDESLVGVIELASFSEFGEVELELLNQAAEVLAVALSVNLARQRVNQLLQQSQAQEEELRVQQEELQQSNEELEERAQLLDEQRKQIEAKNRDMEEASREIVRKAREVEQVSGYKSEFLANMSHELRTPLNSLMILSGHLRENREGNLTPRQVEYANTINAAGSDLLDLINEILDLSKIEAGRVEFVYAEAHPAELCEQLTSIFTPVAEQKGVKFSTSLAAGLPAPICIDAQRTLQILKNLLSNAMKFTPEGAVRLHIHLPGPGEQPLPVPAIAFSVTDTGIGVPKEKHELIFQAFQQADGSTSRKFGGTGLGLSISRQLARGMNGEILLAAQEGGGSSFTLYLPVTPSNEGYDLPVRRPALAPDCAPTRASLPAPGISDDRERVVAGERCILIIEDDPTFAGVLVERVRERDFAAIVAVDGDAGAGVELAERYLPSAILLDVMLRGLDGWGVMQRLKESLRVRHIPVHFLTCLEERQKALAMGAIGYITKPVTGGQLDAVLGTIEDAVSRSLRRLLIVEDDPAHARALVALLEERNVAITVAANGARAIEELSAERFDCVVLDLGLADMSGFELLEHIRSLEEKRRIPVIIHTGKELSAEETLRLQHYAESVIIKGAKSPERLLNEVTLFLHVMEGRLPPDKRRMIRATLNGEALFAEKKVLLVDDDMRNVFSLSSVLSEKGMRVVEAENGRVALEMLQEHPDVNLVLMDVMMPEMDGLEATREIRRDPRFARLPVIALTAKAMKGDREACLKAGASDYITKPVDLDRLMSLLRVWLYQDV
jgi:CheY-like chemotaxis protein